MTRDEAESALEAAYTTLDTGLENNRITDDEYYNAIKILDTIDLNDYPTDERDRGTTEVHGTVTDTNRTGD